MQLASNQKVPRVGKVHDVTVFHIGYSIKVVAYVLGRHRAFVTKGIVC